MATPMTGTNIYAFPPRGRFALRIQNDGIALANVQLPEGAEFAHQGSGWYHEEAVQEEQHGQPNRKN
jgi:hypothetical protein